MAVKELTLSEFLQHSGSVLPELEAGEVVLRRRDGDDLVLMTRRHNLALTDIARAFFALSTGEAHAVEAIFPWLAFLSATDREECIRELREVGAAALETGRLGRLAETLYAWKATAYAVWDDRQQRERVGYSDDDPLDLPRPSP
jgi:hypothetical protein